MLEYAPDRTSASGLAADAEEALQRSGVARHTLKVQVSRKEMVTRCDIWSILWVG